MTTFRSQYSGVRIRNREPVRAYSYTRRQSPIARSRGMSNELELAINVHYSENSRRDCCQTPQWGFSTAMVVLAAVAAQSILTPDS
jgi:hypothetical protein